jgi:two-component system, cell cycle sensor histidine kinase and response regulator CckA
LNSDFVTLLESLANGVVIADQAGNIVYSNQFLEKMFGYERGELLGRSVEEFLPGELRKAHSQHRVQYSKSPETRLMGAGRDLLARRKDGSVISVEVGLSPMKTPEGLRVVAIVTDISTRKHAEQRSILQRDVALILSRSDSIESSALKLLETIGTTLGWKVGCLWLVDNATKTLRNAGFWHSPNAPAPAFEAVSRGATIQNGDCILGHVWETGSAIWVTNLADEKRFTRAQEALAAGLRSAFELPILAGSQVLGLLEFFSSEISLRDDALIEIAAAVASQIAQFMERKRSEKALGVFEERYRSLFENAVFGILRSSASGEILDINPALVAVLGYDSVDELQGVNLNDIYKNPRDRKRLIEESKSQNQFDAFETEWKTKSGGTIQVRLSGRVVRATDGSLAGFEAIIEDISQRKLLEQQFRQAQKMEAIGRLAGGVAHDFNNLLTIIAVSTDTLFDLAGSNEPLRQTTDEIARATEQGASLVRQLMAFSRTQPQTPDPVSLNEVIKSSHRMVQILAGEDIRFELNLHIDHCLVAMEPNRLEQILMNIVTNARDAMADGGVIAITTAPVHIDQEQSTRYVGLKPARYVRLDISDTGHGIPAEILPHIFEPFFSTKGEGRGSGLGLSSVYGIVRQYQGQIQCETRVGEGTTFTIFLPAAERGAPAPAPSNAAEKVPRGTETILLVEDEPALRTSVSRILEQNGYSVVVASDGFEALKKAANPPNGGFNLLVTDIALPQMRGTELAKQLIPRFPKMRVLYMSGYSEEKVPPDAAHFIPKPFRREALIRKIREVLDA